MKLILFLNLYVILGFIIGFLVLDFCYLWYTDDLYYSIQNFAPTSFISFLFYRIYILIVILIILNVLEIFSSKLYSLEKKLFAIESIIISLFLISYGALVDNYFFILPALSIVFFLNVRKRKNHK